MRQAAGGLVYALISVVLVLGSLSVAVAERNSITAPAPTNTSRASVTAARTQAASSTATAGNTETTQATATTTTPIRVPSSTSMATYPSAAPTRRAATSTHAVTVQCGPFPGWIKAYVVQPGDTLFHLATLYRTTVPNLQRANCKTSNVIYAGEWLWVPNVATATAGVTIIPPFFDTPTDEATAVIVTETPQYSTPTTAATDTGTPSAP